jgi:Kef-type K+ transport system membrane component KefB
LPIDPIGGTSSPLLIDEEPQRLPEDQQGLNRHQLLYIHITQSDGDGVPHNRSQELMTPAVQLLRQGFVREACPVGGFFCAHSRERREKVMDNIWFQSALWMALALLAAMGSFFITISAALFEIMIGAVAGNTVGLPLTDWINYIASFGAVVLTFLAGTDIDPHVIKRNFGSSVTIGLMGFFAPYLGCLLFARYGLGWPWPQAQIAGIALSTTSVAVVYAVMVETGYNRTELGKIILAACFINDIGTVLALGLIFANYNLYLLLFVTVTILAVAVLPCIVSWLFKRIGGRASEPEIKFLFLVLFALGGLATLGKSEAVLPAYLVGMALAPFFVGQKELQFRLRAICFAFLTPFYFLKAGSLIEAHALAAGAGFIALFLAIKMVTKFAGILPLTRYFAFGRREGMYTTMMMSTGLTFGSISALFGLTNNIIDQFQYTILLTAVIGSAVVPTVIAQVWFQPRFEQLEEDA